MLSEESKKEIYSEIKQRIPPNTPFACIVHEGDIGNVVTNMSGKALDHFLATFLVSYMEIRKDNATT